MGEEKAGSEHGRRRAACGRGMLAAVSILFLVPAVRKALEKRHEKQHARQHKKLRFERKHFAMHGH